MSTLFSLNWRDAVKGIIIAVLAAILTGLYQALASQAVIDPKQLLIVGATAGLSYIIKNFFSDSSDKLGGIL